MRYGCLLVLLFNVFFTFAYAVNSATCSLLSPTSRCSCFQIAPDLIATSYNCVHSVSNAKNTKVNFTDNPLKWRQCSELTDASKTYGTSVLKCNIGTEDSYGIIKYDGKLNTNNLYVTSYNCNTNGNPHCRPVKESNLCKVTGRKGIFNHILTLACSTTNNLNGAPVFIQDTHQSGAFVCIYSSDGTDENCYTIDLIDKFPYNLITSFYDLYSFFKRLVT